MTQWVENPEGGRETGPAGLARAWVEVLVRPRRFFRAGVAPADQAPGLVFAVLVVLFEEASRFALVPGAVPVAGDQVLASAVLALAAAAFLVAPAALHLVAALQTLVLIAFLDDRAGVSETVQVIAYATAPCVLAGLPVPALRVACTLYGAALLAVGITVVHDTSLPRGVALSVLPGALVFGYAFRGFGAAATLLSPLW